ncbi:MAG: exodeoxyribonuclease V subunit alpha [Bacteroidota bacterium]
MNRYILHMYHTSGWSLFTVEFLLFMEQETGFQFNDTIRLLGDYLELQRSGSLCLVLNEPWFLHHRDQLTASSLDELFKQIEQEKIITKPSGIAPFILEDDRVYTHKFWSYEQRTVDWISEQLSLPLSTAPNPSTREWIELNSDEKQRKAVYSSLSHRFSIITGGPGTGKTFTVLQVLSTLLMESDEPLSIGLAAPTGKAARRLAQSIEEGKTHLNVEERVHEQMPSAVHTAHKLLGSRGLNQGFTYNIENPLPYDVLVVDEASMLDIVVWTALISAMKPETRLILLGDSHQLSSVEAGSVLGDLVDGLTTIQEDLSVENLTELKTAHRFSGSPDVLDLANAIKGGEYEQAMTIVNASGQVHQSAISNETITDLVDRISQTWLTGGAIQLLCALRKGPLGSIAFNQRIEQQVKSKSQIPDNQEWYEDRPIIITKNDAMNNLRNGQVGKVINREGEWVLAIEEIGEHIPVTNLTAFEPAYALTIHKSQGSEYDDVAIVLDKQPNKVLFRELLYTGVTRAKKSVLILSDDEILAHTIAQRQPRTSGIDLKIEHRFQKKRKL